MLVEYSRSYLKAARRLPWSLTALAGERERLFLTDPYHPSLRTHKLNGKDKGSWAFWINQKYRVKFLFLASEHVFFIDVGTHDIYS